MIMIKCVKCKRELYEWKEGERKFALCRQCRDKTNAEELNKEGNWKNSEERISEVLEKVKGYWIKHPDQNIHQVISGLISKTTEPYQVDREIWQWADYFGRSKEEQAAREKALGLNK